MRLITSATHEILSSLSLWSFLLWIFFCRLYSEISPEWLRSFQLPVWRCHCHSAYICWIKTTATFLGTSSLSYFENTEVQAVHSIFPHTHCLCHFSSFGEWILNTDLTLTLGNFHDDSRDLWKRQLVMSGSFSFMCEISRIESIEIFSMYLLNKVLFKFKLFSISDTYRSDRMATWEGERGKGEKQRINSRGNVWVCIYGTCESGEGTKEKRGRWNEGVEVGKAARESNVGRLWKIPLSFKPL